MVESYVRLFLKTLYGYRRQGRFYLHAFVLMPDHVHLIFYLYGWLGWLVAHSSCFCLSGAVLRA